MPNYCAYDMKIIGKKENVEEFIKILKADYSYSHNEFSFPRHMFRVFSAEVYDTELREENIFIAQVCGDCAWSVFTCMFEDGYYRDVLEAHPDNFKGTTAVRESENLQLDIEIFSSESGMCFQEHYLIKHGSLEISEEKEWFEYDLNNYETKEEAEKETNIKITNEEWENRETDSFISRGGFEWEYNI